MRAWICTDDTRASWLQVKGRRCYFSQNIGPAVAGSAGPASPSLDVSIFGAHTQHKPWISAIQHLEQCNLNVLCVWIEVFRIYKLINANYTSIQDCKVGVMVANVIDS